MTHGNRASWMDIYRTENKTSLSSSKLPPPKSRQLLVLYVHCAAYGAEAEHYHVIPNFPFGETKP